MADAQTELPPLFIIGAGRSGTNILRDCITAAPGWETWDCDEINLIMRHGNKQMPHDEFDASHARPDVTRYIHGQFDKLARATGASMVVEKTCANSLRVPFLNAMFPQARFLFLVRDGRDVALSAAQRWVHSVEPKYLLKKLRFVPPMDIPYYGRRFITNRWHQSRSAEKRQSLWGPVFEGMKDWSIERPLIEVCARQWAESAAQADAALAKLEATRVHRVSYEQLAAAPRETLCEIAHWIDPAAEATRVLAAGQNIRALQKDWRAKSDQFTPEALALMAPTLQRFGYETAA